MASCAVNFATCRVKLSKRFDTSSYCTLSALDCSSKDATHSLDSSVMRVSRCSNSSLNRFNEASNKFSSSFGCPIFAPL